VVTAKDRYTTSINSDSDEMWPKINFVIVRLTIEDTTSDGKKYNMNCALRYFEVMLNLYSPEIFDLINPTSHSPTPHQKA